MADLVQRTRSEREEVLVSTSSSLRRLVIADLNCSLPGLSFKPAGESSQSSTKRYSSNVSNPAQHHVSRPVMVDLQRMRCVRGFSASAGLCGDGTVSAFGKPVSRSPFPEARFQK